MQPITMALYLTFGLTVKTAMTSYLLVELEENQVPKTIVKPFQPLPLPDTKPEPSVHDSGETLPHIDSKPEPLIKEPFEPLPLHPSNPESLNAEPIDPSVIEQRRPIPVPVAKPEPSVVEPIKPLVQSPILPEQGNIIPKLPEPESVPIPEGFDAHLKVNPAPKPIAFTPEVCCRKSGVPDMCMGLCMDPTAASRSLPNNVCAKFEKVMEECFYGVSDHFMGHPNVAEGTITIKYV